MINQDIIAQDLFYKIRSRFPKMEMGDESGQSTFEAAKGRFFDFDAIFNEHNLGTVSISINEPGSLKLYFNKNILEDADESTSKTWYSFLREMRKFAMKRLMSFDTRDISKTNLDKRDYGYLANKGPVMSESMMRGTSRTSYRPLEALQRTKLIIRHSKPVDESIPGARSRNLESLFIENAIGERFKYPFKHLAGAKAMQRHVANEGLPHDPIGQKIIEMSEDMAKLSNFKNYVYREDLMNSGTSNIVERAQAKLQELKEKINRISMQHHYEAFKRECESNMGTGNGDMTLIDEITLEDYKDKFTVKSFREDIADVFPLLHRIMQENELDLDEVASIEDQTPELNLEEVATLTPESMFDVWAQSLVETRLDPDELSKLGELLSEHFPVGINGDNVTGTLEEFGIDVPDSTKIQLAQLAEQQGPDANAVDVVMEFLSEFQPEIYSALDASVQEGLKGGMGVVGDMADKAMHSFAFNPLTRLGVTGAAVAGGGKYYNDKEKALQAEKDAIDYMVNPGKEKPDHFLDPSNKTPITKMPITKENMEQTPEERKAAAEYMAQVAQAIRSGEVNPEDVEDEFYNTLPYMGVSDEKIMAAWNRITGSQETAPRRTMSDKDIDAELKGVDSDDDDDAQFIANLRDKAKSGSIRQDTSGFGAEMDEGEELQQDEKKHSGQAPMKKIAEFIMGFYDKNTGNFPLGETGVKIKVEKEFGDRAGELAERLIQKLAHNQEDHQMFEDIKVLSGQVKRDSTLVAISKSPVKTMNVNEGTDFIDLKKLAGIGTKSHSNKQAGEVIDLKKLAGI